MLPVTSDHSRWDPSSCWSCWLARILSAPRTAAQERRTYYSYVLCKSEELQTTYSDTHPPKQRFGHSRISTRTAVAKSAACASNSHQADQRHCYLSCRTAGNFASGQTHPWKRVSAPPNLQTAHAELSPRPTSPLPEQSIAAPDPSSWQRAAPLCATSRSRRSRRY